MIGHGDYTHHTSEDTPDKVDPVELERSEIIAAGAFLFLSDLTEDEAVDLAYLVAANGSERIASAARRARSLQGPDAVNTVRYAGVWERQALESILTFQDSPEVRSAIRRLVTQLETLSEGWMRDIASLAGSSPQATLDERVPTRLTRGPLDFGLPETKLSPENSAWYRGEGRALNGTVRFELVNFIDGERTISEIRDAVSAEFSPIPTEVVARYFEDLARAGVVNLQGVN
jgi:hypothetical protein